MSQSEYSAAGRDNRLLKVTVALLAVILAALLAFTGYMIYQKEQVERIAREQAIAAQNEQELAGALSAELQRTETESASAAESEAAKTESAAAESGGAAE